MPGGTLRFFKGSCFIIDKNTIFTIEKFLPVMTYNHPKFLVAVDCVIFGYEDSELKVLLRHRDFDPGKGGWSLPGGFVNEKESVEDAALRVLFETTGLKDIFLEQIYTFSEPNRDPGERVISVSFFALIKIQDHDTELVRKNGAHWIPISELPELIFDHKAMVDQALLALQTKAANEVIGRELLPDFFTFNQLVDLYYAIYKRPFDPSNFRKKVKSLNVIERLNFKDKANSRKGAFYYRFKEPEQIEPYSGMVFRLHNQR